MNNTAALHRNSFPFFLIIPFLAVVGFWQTWFTGSFRPLSVYDHVHGLAMFGWCFMLIAQSFLIRQGRRDLHRIIGKTSYGLMPFIAVSVLMLANYRLNERGLNPEGYYLLSLQILALIQIVVFYSLAIKNRKRSDVHARYMICTALPLLDPILARILIFHVLGLENVALAQFITYPFANLILVALVVWDWKNSNRRDVFLPMWVVLTATQLPVFFVVGSPAWQAFAAWYIQLPIS